MIYAGADRIDEYFAFEPLTDVVKKQDSRSDEPSASDLRVQILEEKLFRVRDLAAGWDSYNAPSPNGLSVERAAQGLRMSRLMRNLPGTIVASAEGGVALCWDSQSKHAYIEYANDASVLFVMYEGMNDPSVDEISPSLDSITRAIDRVQRFISA